AVAVVAVALAEPDAGAGIAGLLLGATGSRGEQVGLAVRAGGARDGLLPDATAGGAERRGRVGAFCVGAAGSEAALSPARAARLTGLLRQGAALPRGRTRA